MRSNQSTGTHATDRSSPPLRLRLYPDFWPARRIARLLGALAATAMIHASIAAAPAAFRSSASTDADPQQIMQGAPPPADKQVSLENVLQFPNARWAFRHMRQLAPTSEVSANTPGRPQRHRGAASLNEIEFGAADGRRLTIRDWQRDTYTDGLIVFHSGHIVYETYHVGMNADEPHAHWSMSKSFVGLLCAMLFEEGRIDPDAAVSRYIPELARTAWGSATIQQTLDMTTRAAYSEQLGDPASGLTQMRARARLPLRQAARRRSHY